jgi:hypothetical protein
MRILFCNDDLEPRSVDSFYRDEAQAASACGLKYNLISFNEIRVGHAGAAIRFASHTGSIDTAIYRGWMLTLEEYQILYSTLEQKHVRLVNSPEQYAHCHWFPNSYPAIEEHTPESTWLPASALHEETAIANCLKLFGESPIIVKDYVKSRKHEWFEACFIPNAADEPHAGRIIERFLELQGDDLQGGLVLRRFVEFEPIGTHPKSGMPLTLEYRLFVLDGSVIDCIPYWDADYEAERPPLTQFESVLKSIKSRFFSCDVAKTTDGRWLIVELGDGQVAGLPERCNVASFYQALSERSK